MPPITASSWRSSATMRLVISKRFMVFACSRLTGWFAGSAISPLLFRKDFAAGQQRRQDEAARRLGCKSLRDAAVHDEGDIFQTGQRVVLDQQGVQHWAHRAGDELLADVELAHGAAL